MKRFFLSLAVVLFSVTLSSVASAQPEKTKAAAKKEQPDAPQGEGKLSVPYTGPVAFAGLDPRAAQPRLAVKGLNSPDAVNNYSVVRATGITFSSISGTGTSVASWRNGTSLDDNLSNSLPIGFTFIYNGGAYTQFRVSTNGFMTFNTTSTATGAGTNPYDYHNDDLSASSASTTAFSPVVLAPMWDDLTVPAAGTLAGNIKYLTTGVSPNRILTVEWIGMEVFANAGPDLNFQVKLYEVDGHMEFIYGTMTASTATYSYTSGINASTVSASPTAAELLTQQTANTATFNNTASNALSTVPAANTRITFTPPATTPAAATSLTFPTIGASYVTMSWADNATNETNYNVLISTDSGVTYQAFGAIFAANTTGATITGLVASTTYFFRVIATTEGVASTPLDNSVTTSAPVSGTKTLGPGGDYTSFTLAISDVNAGVGGSGVTFNVTAGTTFTEDPPCVTGGDAAHPVVFQRSGAGANPVIKPTGSAAGTQDSGICILGGDFITFDGIDVTPNGAGNTNVEYGALVFNLSATNGAQNDTIKNSKITLNRTNTSSIGINQTLSIAATAASGANSNNKYYNITIENASRGILLNGTSATVNDTANEIGVTGGGTTTIGAATANDIGNGTAATYGITAALQSGVKIFNTEVRNVTGTSTGTVEGIVLSNTGSTTGSVGTNDIFNNQIHDIKSTSSSATSHVVSGIRANITANAASVARIYNNFIYGLDNSSTNTASRQLIGIRLQDGGSGAGSTFNIDFNSVRIAPTGISCSNSNFEMGTTTPVYKVRDNIFANVTGAQTTVKHYTWVSTSASSIGAAGSVSDRNDLYIANTTNGFVGLGSATDRATLANWQTQAAGVDTNSISTDPLFLSTTDLHISSSSPAIEGGSFFAGAITWAGTDIDAQTRPNGALPDIGADEFYPSPGSVQFSSATYTVTETGVTATITVTRTGGSNGAASVNYATVAGGSATAGGSCGGSVDYVTTSGTLNWADLDAASKTFTVTICNDGVPEASETVNLALSGAVTASLGTPNTAVLTITNAGDTFSGSINVGTGQTYTTLSSAISSLNAGTVTGATTLVLTDATYPSETFPITINALTGASSTNTVTIKPNTGVAPTITGSSATCMITFNGADFVTIDGSNTVGGTTRDLTINNTGTAAGCAVVCVASLGTGLGATNDVVKNTNIAAGTNQATGTTLSFGIFSGGNGTPAITLDGVDNDNNTFNNNFITSARYGIYLRGGVSNANDNNTVSQNLIGPSAFGATEIGRDGIVIQHQNLANVTRNEVRFVGGDFANRSTFGKAIGIGIGSETGPSPTTSIVTNSTVTRNLIHDIVDEKTGSAIGIEVGEDATAASNNIVANNMLYNIRANGTSGDQTNGISIGGGNGDKVVFNSILLTGDLDPGSSSSSSESASGVRIVSATPVNLTLTDNISSVDLNSNTSTLKHYAFVKPSATYSFGTGGATNNDYFINVSNAQMVLFGNGTSVPYADVTTLGTWQGETPAHDQNSKVADPAFISATNLHLQTSSAALGAGVSIAGVTNDFDGDTRPAVPDIGADEILQAGSLQFSSPTYGVNENGGNATITVTRTGGLDGAVGVSYGTSNGAAVQPGDYTTTTGSLSWTDGDSADKTFNVPIINDTIYENAEDFNVALNTPTGGATLGTPNTAAVTITDNDTAPSISIDNVTVSEGVAGGNAVFTVTQSAVSGATTTFNYASAGVTATANVDYTTVGGVGSIPAGSTTTTISVPILEDTLYEYDETFTVTLSGAVNASIGTGVGTGTITDNDTAPTLSIDSVSVVEGANAVFTVTQSAITGRTTTFQYDTTNGTAVAPGDYTAAVAATGSIPAGSTTTTITIPTIDDNLYEGGNETFTVTLSNEVFGTTHPIKGSSNVGTGTIQDNDSAPTVQFSSTTYSVNENGGNATITVTKTGATQLSATVNYTTTTPATATAGASCAGTTDYVTTSGTLTFASGDTSMSFNVPICNDTTFEGNENFTVSLSGPSGATLGSPSSATVTIVEDDGLPLVQFSQANFDVNEAAGTVTVTVTKTGATALPSTINYATSNGSATAGSDYTTTSGTLTFLPTQTSQTFDVPILPDSVYEGDEQFTVTLSTPVGCSIGAQNPSTVTILEDDDPPAFSIDSGVEHAEGNSLTTSFVFTVTKTGSTALNSSVVYTAQDGTSGSPATLADSDYQSATGTLTFLPNETSMQFTVLVNGDTKYENQENFIAHLSTPVNATINGSQNDKLGLIDNDDDPPTISIDSVTVGEAGGPAVFTVTQSAVSGLNTTFQYSTADGTAVAPGDYTALVNEIGSIPAGSTTTTISVAIINDTTFENSETFTVTLSNEVNATLGTATGTGTITDNDTAPSISINDVTVNEADGNAVFTVTQSAVSGKNTTFTYSTANGTAVAPGDYTAASNVAGGITAGNTTTTISVPIINDNIRESNETFTVTLSNEVNATLGTATGTGTITANDDAPTFSIDNVTQVETNSGTTNFVFTVTKVGETEINSTVDYHTEDGTATDADNDYEPATGTLTFGPTVTTQQITVVVNGDTTVEPDETFTVVLNNPTGRPAAPDLIPPVATGTGTILNDDCTTPAGGMISWWSAENNADDIYGANPGTTFGGVTYPAGKVGLAFGLDGTDDYVEVADSPSLNPNAITVDAWIYLDELRTVQFVLAKDNGSSARDYFIDALDDQIKFVVINQAGTASGEAASATGALTINTWYHFAGTYDGTDVKAYLNGVEVASTPYSGGIGHHNTPVWIGQRNGASFFKGRIDEVEIFDHALTGAQIAALYSASGAGKCHTSTFQFSSATYNVTEGNSNVNATITVTRTGAHDTPADVNYSVSDGTAIGAEPGNCGDPGVDYTSVSSGTLNFAANETSKTFNVVICGDTIVEGDETVNLALTGVTGAGASLGSPTSAVLTIHDDDTYVSVAVSPASVLEDGATNLVYTFTRVGQTSGALTVNFSVSGTAAFPGDYSQTGADTFAATGTVTFGAGSSTATVTVDPTADSTVETNETVILVVTSGTGYFVGTPSLASGTITNDDTAVSVAVSPASVLEDGAPNLVYTFTRNPVTPGAVTVNFSVSGTADFSTDYTQTGADTFSATSGTVTIGAGNSTATVTIDPSADTTRESDETAILTVTSGTGYNVGSPAAATGTITNDDAAPTFTVNNVTQAETNSGTTNFVFTVTKNGNTDLPSSVQYQTQDSTATAPSDYTAIPLTTLNFAANETTKQVTVVVNGDTTYENDETFLVLLSNPLGRPGDPKPTIPDVGGGLGTITNDDTQPSFSINDVSHNEGNTGTTAYTFTVTKTGSTEVVATVDYATADNTATAPSDYTAITATTLTFQPSDATKTLTVNVNGDTTPELDETFFVNLSTPTAATISDNQGVGTIVNDDCDPTPSGMAAWWPGQNNTNDIIGPNNGIAEGSLAYTAGVVGQAFSFNGTNADMRANASSSLNVGTGSGLTFDTWLNPTSLANPQVIAEWNGGTSNTIGVHVWHSLTNVGVSGPGNVYVNIFDGNTSTHHVFSTNPNALTTGGYQHLAVTYDKATGNASIYRNGTALPVVCSTLGCTPVNSTTVNLGSFTPQTSYNFYLGVRPSTGLGWFSGQMDEVELFNRALSAAEVANIYTAGSVGKCHTSTLQFSSATYSVNEGGGNAVITVTRTGTHDIPATVDYATVAGGTAIGGASCGGATEYVTTTGTLSFAANEVSKTFNVPVCDDFVTDGSKTVNLQLSNVTGSGTSLGSPSTAVLTIVDDDCLEPPPANMIAWYPAEGNYNDIQGPTFENGLASGGAVPFAAGKVGQAFSFNGTTAFLNMGTPAALNITGNQVTLDGWINPAVSDFVTRIYFGRSVSTGNDYMLFANGGGGLAGSIKTSTGETFLNTFAALPANTWSHIALTYDGANMKLYLNGAVVATQAKTGNITNSGSPFVIGGRGDGNRFGGLIDEVEVFDRALASNEILDIYNAGAVGKCKHGLIQFSAPTYTVGEAGGNATITVRRIEGSKGAVTARFDTSDGTAVAGSDYTAVTNFTVSWADGDAADKTVNIPITNDSLYEIGETVNLALTNATGGAQIGSQSTAVLTINDNDTAPTISINSVSVSEGGGNAVFTVTQSAISGANTTFTYSTADGSATAGSDYTGATNVAGGITAGNTTTTISIPITDDGVYEGNEDFTVTLSNPVNATIASGQGTGTGTITENDSQPSFSINDVTHNEGDSSTTSYVFTVTKSGSTALSSSVNFQTQDGSATIADSDYQSNSGPLTFAAGDTTMQVTVLVNGDKKTETNEDFTVHLSGASNATISDADGTGTITNDDHSPVAPDVSVSTERNVSKIITLAATDSDGDALTFSIVTPPAHGTLGSISSPSCTAGSCTATVTYSPNCNYTGPDSFTFRANDGTNNSNIATAGITVTPHTAPVVTNTSDNNTGSLRQALLAAQNGDTITFNIPTSDPGYNAGTGVWTITLTSGQLVVDKNVVISGLGANVLTVTRGAAAPFRIFLVNSTGICTVSSPESGPDAPLVAVGIVTIEKMTISNGDATGGIGGGINNDHVSLTVSSCTVAGNSADFGGGLFNDGGVAIISDSTFSGNSTGLDGGAVFNNGTLTVTNSTFSGNNARYAGGINNGNGGAATLTVANSTFIANGASFDGGGIRGFSGSVTLGNTIVAGNTAAGSGRDIAGTVSSAGYNLIGNTTNPGDFGATDQLNVDPMLGPLKNNGGPTKTHAPLINSPAIDQGKRSAIPALNTNVDQRGSTRPVDDAGVADAASGDGSDIGAVEIGSFVHPTGADSWKTHFGVGDFPVPLPLPFTSPIGVECRTGAVPGEHKIIVTFTNVNTFSGVAVTTGTGSATAALSRPESPESGGTQITVNLTGVTNAQAITVALFGVDTGTATADVGIRMGVLLGDTTSTHQVDSSDVSEVQFESGHAVTNLNFRDDLTTNGEINSTDVSTVEFQSGTGF